MAGYFGNLAGALMGRTPPAVSPYKEAGTSGTAIFGGYVENIERDRKLSGTERYRTAADLLANVSIIAASVRYILNLTAAPRWTIKPAMDLGDSSSDAAKEAAEFVQRVLFEDLNTSWTRLVRRTGMYRYHGFGIQEWTAIRRADGLIGFADIESRPQHTIEQWQVDEHGAVEGVWQRSPQTGALLWIPRAKTMYLVDDSLTDSPEGMGLFRHLVDPGERIRRYLKLEGQGYERELRGIPIGRAPLADIRAQVNAGSLTAAEGRAMVTGLRNFIKMEVKEKDTGLLLDSTPYNGITADGTTVSGTPKWGVELLTGEGGSFSDLGKAIDRLTHDMARIIGAESLLLGSGANGSRALSEDKSKNLYLVVNGSLADIAEATNRDLIGALWSLNGLPDELRPHAEVEDAAFKDAAGIAATLRDMATAGAVLAPDDPAIDDLRALLGVSPQPERDPTDLMVPQTFADPNAEPDL
jgi:hypothetical protein